MKGEATGLYLIWSGWGGAARSENIRKREKRKHKGGEKKGEGAKEPIVAKSEGVKKKIKD